MRRVLVAICFLATGLLPAATDGSRIPTVDDLLNLETIGEAVISPDGLWVAYTVNSTDFEEQAFLTQIWLVSSQGGDAFQLTRAKKSSQNPQWAPDGKWLAFERSAEKGKSQIFAIRPGGGEAFQLSDAEDGIGDFRWSPDSSRIAFTASPAATEKDKERKKYFGEYRVVQGDYEYQHLWVLEVSDALKKPSAGVQHTKGKEFSVRQFTWSPDGKQIAFTAPINPDLIRGDTSDLFLLDLQNDNLRKLVTLPGPEGDPHWSPDGREILFSTYDGADQYYALNSRLAVIPAAGGKHRIITAQFDENPAFVEWNGDGIYFQALQKTASHLFRLDPAGSKSTRVSSPEDLMGGSFSLAGKVNRMAFVADSPTTLREVYVSAIDKFAPRRLTQMTDQTKNFKLGTREVIHWKSQDGEVIEGVLIKPADFDPSVRRPLLCVIHGGPTGIDRPGLLQRGTRYYPVDIWAARGALILQVNYRGSAGYGEKFRRLNMRNLGVGDAWDVLSGVDYLIEKGWVDPARVGSMGWSQGGYISAFLTTSSDRFAAISVGAGISNWATYYYNTDITPFTINYLGDDPIDDPEIYSKTSPMSYIKKAKTPTLIQHGELDRRVPIPNAYELRQGLEDRGVPVEMIVYKGFGHGINKPREMRAVMVHNLLWFNHYLWGDPLPELDAIDIPKEAASKDSVESGNRSH